MTARIGSWWLAKHDALRDEAVAFSILANRTQSSNRAVGGKLFATNRRILFSPHLLDCVLGGTKTQIRLSAIRQIDVQPAGGDRLGGGIRDRLRIVTNHGTELFVVNELDEVIRKLRTLHAGHG
jgi:hypothetical protein